MPEMRQLPDGTWLNEQTGVVVAPEGFAYAAGQNDVYSGPPLLPPGAVNPTPPLGMQRRGVLPPAQAPIPQQPVGTGLRAPRLGVSPYELGIHGVGTLGEGVKKIGAVAAIIGVVYLTVIMKNKINGKKKKS